MKLSQLISAGLGVAVTVLAGPELNVPPKRDACWLMFDGPLHSSWFVISVI